MRGAIYFLLHSCGSVLKRRQLCLCSYYKAEAYKNYYILDVTLCNLECNVFDLQDIGSMFLRNVVKRLLFFLELYLNIPLDGRWLGRDISRIIVTSATRSSPTQELYCILSTSLSLIPHSNRIYANRTKIEEFYLLGYSALYVRTITAGVQLEKKSGCGSQGA
jgi:hypothetical protein